MSAHSALIRDVKLVDIYQDEAGKVWLFYAEPYSASIRTVGVKIEDRGDFIAVLFRFLNKFAVEQEPAMDGECTPEPEHVWKAKQPDWDNSRAKPRVMRKAEEFEMPQLQVVELPFMPQKELRISEK